MLLVGGIDEGLQDVVGVLSRLSALLNHLEKYVLDLLVSSVPFPNQDGRGVSSTGRAESPGSLQQQQQAHLKLGRGSQPGSSQAA